MQVTFSGGTPLLALAPCRDCDPDKGWHSFADFEGVHTDGDSNRTNGTDLGFVTTAPNSSVGLNFTGTGIEFNLMFAPAQQEGAAGGYGPGAGAGTGGTSTGWTTKILVNGSEPPAIAEVAPTSVVGLPNGRHTFTLELTRTDGKTGNETWAQLASVQGTTASMLNAKTANTTIDDTAWRNGTIKLSDGWNMLETNSNWINETQYQAELANQDRFYNKSISWTTNEGANTTVTFKGSAVWAFGHTGGESGTYEVRLDNESQGTFNAAGGPRTYNQTLFFTSGLTDAEHTLQLINRGGRLSYDAFVSSTGLDSVPTLSDGAPKPTVGTTTGDGPASPTGDSSAGDSAKAHGSGHKGLKTAVVAGISVAAVVGALLLTFLAFLIWSRCRRRNKRPAHAWQQPRPWYKKMTGRDKGWKFENLVDDPSRQMAQRHSVWDRVSRSDTHLSSSSFGSSAAPCPPPPAHTRRSLLPLANNLWAKAKRAPSDKGMQMTDVSSRKPESPDPMALALGGAASPLTQLQRSCSTDRVPKGKVTNTQAASGGTGSGNVWDRERQRQRAQQEAGQRADDGWNEMFAPSSYGSDTTALSGGTVIGPPSVTAGASGVRQPNQARGQTRTYYNDMPSPPRRY